MCEKLCSALVAHNRRLKMDKWVAVKILDANTVCLLAAGSDAVGPDVFCKAADAEALRKDAERYRWLRDKTPGEIVFDHTASQSEGGPHFLLRVPFDGEPVHNDEHSGMKLDAAIDAALAVG